MKESFTTWPKPQQSSPKKPQEERKKKEAEKKSFLDGILNSLNPFTDSDGNFSFGSSIMSLLVLVGIGLFAASETGQNLIGRFFGEDAKNTVGGWIAKGKAWFASTFPDAAAKLGLENAVSDVIGTMTVEDARESNDLKSKVPAAIFPLITKDKATWDNFLETVKTANGNLNPASFTSEKTILALLTTQKTELKTMVNGMLTVLNAPPDPTLTEEQKKKEAEARAPFYASLRSLVAGPSFNEMFNTQNRAATLGVLMNFVPGGFKTPAALEAAFKAMDFLDAGGTPTQKLRDFLTKKFDPDAAPEANTLPALPDVKNNAAAQKQQVDAIIMPQMELLLGATNAPLLRQALGDARLLEFAQLKLANDVPGMTRFQAANLADLKSFADKAVFEEVSAEYQPLITSLKTVNRDALPAISHCMSIGVPPEKIKNIFIETRDGVDQPFNVNYAINGILNGENRKAMFAVGKDCLANLIAAQVPEYKSILTPKNIALLYNAARQINLDAENMKTPELAPKVLTAFVEYAHNKNTAFLQALDPKTEIAPFFKNPANCNAVKTLLTGLEGLDGKQAALLAAFGHEWGNLEDGIAEVLADPAGAAFLKDKMLSTETSHVWDWVASAYLNVVQGGKIGENSGHIIALGKACKRAIPKPAHPLLQNRWPITIPIP